MNHRKSLRGLLNSALSGGKSSSQSLPSSAAVNGPVPHDALQLDANVISVFDKHKTRVAYVRACVYMMVFISPWFAGVFIVSLCVSMCPCRDPECGV